MTDPSLGTKKKKITIAASVEGVEVAEKALIRLGFDSKSNFAKSQLLARTTVTKFFQREPIQLDSFKRICEVLKLSWREIALIPEQEQLGESHCSSSIDKQGVESTLTPYAQVSVIDKQTKKVKIEIRLTGHINSVDNLKFLEFVLREYSGDSIKITDIKEGSIRLFVEGSPEDIERLVSRINSGELKTVTGFPVEGVQVLSESLNDESAESDDKWRLVEQIVSQSLNMRHLGGIDLSDADLSSTDLRNADLSSADLSDADLSDANLSDANLSGANLSGAELFAADLRNANLRNANLSSADLSAANLSGADLSDANLNNTDLKNADLSYADLSYANLRNADLNNANLKNTNLRNADLFAADLRGVNINERTQIDSKWDLKNADQLLPITNKKAIFLRRLIHYRSIFIALLLLLGLGLSLIIQVTPYNKHDPMEAQLNLDLRNADLRNADLRNANLRNADLRNADLRNADLRNADLRNADLSYANLKDANLSYADLRDAKLEGVKINEKTQIDGKWRLVWEIVNQGAKGRDLSNANLSYANLSDANLSYANLKDADLSDANLKDANLKDANLSDADLSHAKLEGVKINEKTQIDGKWRLVWEIVNQGAKGRDLSNTDLSDAYLKYVNLRDLNLRGVNLSDADLNSANLSNANLSNADLKGVKINEKTQIDSKWRLIWEIVNQPVSSRVLNNANLSDANLSSANLKGADLSRANLRAANLDAANLRDADLSNADLSDAILDSTIVANAYFGSGKGLTKDMKEKLKQRGAIFGDRPPVRSPK
ncbi:MAG: pentapeptide repeat-containing protein [Nostoc sp. EkiNYC01]|nr:pentapeptide repeat-containing protein [Nostoc sp. EkiNYC01]